MADLDISVDQILGSFAESLQQVAEDEVLALLKKHAQALASDRGLRRIAQVAASGLLVPSERGRAVERAKALAEIVRSRVEDGAWAAIQSFLDAAAPFAAKALEGLGRALPGLLGLPGDHQ